MITIKSLQQTFFFLEIEGQLVSLKPNEQIIIDETKLNARQLKEIINLTVEDKIELLDYSLNQLKDKLEELSPYYRKAEVDTALESKAAEDHLHSIVTNTENGFMSSSDKTKLDTIEANATVNETDDFLRDRATHTGTQLAATVSDFAPSVRSTALAGLSTATATPITAADSVLSAAGKLQAQINAASQTRKFPAGFWTNQHQLPPTSTLTQFNTLIVYMFFLLPHAITINQIGYAFGTSQSPSQVISARFYDFATGAAATPQINLTGGGFVNSGAITPQTLQAGAYVVAVKPSQVADFFTIASASCPLFPTTGLKATATAKQTVLAGAALPATFPSSGLTYDNSNHPVVNFFVSA